MTSFCTPIQKEIVEKKENDEKPFYNISTTKKDWTEDLPSLKKEIVKQKEKNDDEYIEKIKNEIMEELKKSNNNKNDNKNKNGNSNNLSVNVYCSDNKKPYTEAISIPITKDPITSTSQPQPPQPPQPQPIQETQAPPIPKTQPPSIKETQKKEVKKWAKVEPNEPIKRIQNISEKTQALKERTAKELSQLKPTKVSDDFKKNLEKLFKRNTNKNTNIN